MTQLLEKAISEIKKLSSDEQDAIAAVLISELASERHWERAFDSSAEQLSSLENEALDEYRADKTEPFESRAGHRDSPRQEVS